MRIDREKFPSLFINDLYTKKSLALLDDKFKDLLQDVVRMSKTNVCYVSQSIADNIGQAWPRLSTLRNEINEGFRTILYQANLADEKPTSTIHYGILHREGTVEIMAECVYTSQLNGKTVDYSDVFHARINKEENLHENGNFFFDCLSAIRNQDVIAKAAKLILSTELFLQFAEIETKEVSPNRQIYEGVTCLYNNKTPMPIKVIDSSWFVHLISSGAFKVRGHFRLQPHGHLLKQKKLIWISDYKKDGYTRKAKIESERS